MAKHKSQEKNKKKGSQLVLRVDKAERDAFVALCDRLDSSAAREIRRFMRETIAAHASNEDIPALGTDLKAELGAKANGTIDKCPPSIASAGDDTESQDTDMTVDTHVEEDDEKKDEVSFGVTAKPRKKSVRG